jgi:polar amino acid transport system substrate-binding protein
VHALLERTRAALAPVIVGLQEIQPPADAAPTSAAAGNPEAVAKLLARLQRLLEDNDTEASELIDELLPQLAGTNLAQGLQAVARAISGYDFAAALEALGRIR